MGDDTLRITPDMPVEDLVAAFPRAVGLLMEEGIVCIRCGEPVWGTLGEMIEQKGKDIKRIVNELNDLCA